MATTDPARLPPRTTWYLLTNLPHPRSRRQRAFAPASLEEVVRCYGLRGWVEQGYKQVKNELGWAQFQVRSDRGIRRHWTLVCCAFSFCWRAARTRDASPPTASAARGALGSPPARWTPAPAWPITLRRVRAWLTPWRELRRAWRAWSTTPPPRSLRVMLDWVAGGQPLYLHLPP